MQLATALPAPPSRCPADLTGAIRRAVRHHGDWGETAQRVARALSHHLPGPDILTRIELRGDAGRYRQHLLHAEPDGSFSVVALVWRPGQATPIHDHVTWCVVGVLQGMEYEELFALRDGDTVLEEVGRNVGSPGDVTGFAPPGDIHRVRNRGSEIAVSLHVYGADIARLGTSVRRVYDLPVRRLALTS
jgi:predicted metal-dependent enzyme (double-stranded beta helix superfamily)